MIASHEIINKCALTLILFFSFGFGKKKIEKNTLNWCESRIEWNWESNGIEKSKLKLNANEANSKRGTDHVQISIFNVNRTRDAVRAYFKATFSIESTTRHFESIRMKISISFRKLIIALKSTSNQIQFENVFPAPKFIEKLNVGGKKEIGHETNEKMPVAILFANYTNTHTHIIFISLSLPLSTSLLCSFFSVFFVRSFGSSFRSFHSLPHSIH